MIVAASENKTDEKRFNEALKRMLKTPPKPHVKDSETESTAERKPGGYPAKNDRPEEPRS